MRYLLAVVMVLVFTTGILAQGNVGFYTNGQWINVPLTRVTKPDSAHIACRRAASSANAIGTHTYKNRSTTWPFTGIMVDTSLAVYAGDTIYWLNDSVGHLNASTSATGCLSCQVSTWKAGTPTFTYFSVFVVKDTMMGTQSVVRSYDGSTAAYGLKLNLMDVTSSTADAVTFKSTANSKWGLNCIGTGTGFNSGGIRAYGTNGNGFLGVVGTGGGGNGGGITAGDSSASSAGLSMYASNASGGFASASSDANYGNVAGLLSYIIGGGADALGASQFQVNTFSSSELGGTAAAEIRDSILRIINDSIFLSIRGFGGVRGIVTGGGSDSGCYSASLTAATNAYQNYMVQCYYGTGAGQYAIITRTALNTGDTIRWLPKFNTAVATNDSIRVIPLGRAFFGAAAKVVNDSNVMLATDSTTQDVSNANAAGGLIQTLLSKALADTTKRIGFKGGSGDSVLTPAPTVSVGAVQVYSIMDSVQTNVATHVAANTTIAHAAGVDSIRGGTAPVYVKTIPDSVKQAQAKIILGDTTKRVFSGILNDTTKRVKFSNDSVVAIDPIRTVVLTTPAPTLKQIRDTLIRSADTARIHVNDSGHVLIDDQWTDAQRDSIVARVLAARDSLHLRPIVTPLTPSDTDELRASIVAAIPVEWTAAQRDSIIARVLANRDTAHSIHLAIDTVRDTANADVALDRLQATAVNLIKVIDSVNAILDTLQNVNSALRVDTATGGGGGGEVWTTAQRDSIIDRVLKVRDSVNATLDSLQNLSSTLRLAGSDLDTVYQTVLCNDTIGGDFLLTLSDYRAQVKRKFGVEISNTTWMTDSVLNQLVREAIVTVNPIMRGYKTTKVMVSRFDSSDYPLDSLVGISSVLWHKDDTARSIPYLAREKWATLAVQNTYGGADSYLERPQVYDYTDALISFFPVPTSEDTIQINGWSKIPNITVVSSVAQIPQKYRIAILKYVTFLVARAKQHPLIQTFLDEYKESLVFLAGQNVQVAR